MKNSLRTFNLVVFLAIGMFVFGGCEQRPPEQVKQEAMVQQTQIQKVVIPLDESQGTASVTRNFYFVFDGSGSMGDMCDGQQKIEGAKQALDKFLDKIPADVNLGLYAFCGGEDKEYIPLSAVDKQSFRGIVDNFSAGGGTPLIGAINFATDRLVEQYKKQLGYGEYRLIILTDGDQTDGFGGDLANAVLRTVGYGFQIYTIGLCISGDHPLRAHSMSYRAANNFEDLDKALEAAVAEAEDFTLMDFPSDSSSQ